MTIHKGRALTLLAFTQFVLILDASIVMVALPSIKTDLQFTQADLSWVANAYIIAFGGFLLLGGRVADLVGRRRMFMIGLAVFAVASLAGALSPNATFLVIARGLQGLGSALIAPAALALLMTIFPAGAERNKALGVFGGVAGMGGVAGGVLGGLLTGWLGWESVLYVNVPIGVVMIAAATWLLPEGRDTSAAGFDLAGAATITVGMAVGVFALVDANDAGWLSPQTIVLGALAVVLIAGFIVIEGSVKHPLVPLRIFADAAIRGANIVAVVMTAAMVAMFFFFALYLQQVLGYGPIKAGLGGLPVAMGIAAAATAASQFVTRFGTRNVAAVGLLIAGAGLAWFSQTATPGGEYLADVFGPSLVFAIGAGFAFVSITVAATAPAAVEQSGLASGLINTSQQVGAALGLAVLIAIAAAATHEPSAGGLSAGFQAALRVGAGFAFVAALLSAFLLSGTPAPQPEREEQPETEPGLA